jgi:hypothetical protein
VLGLAAELPFSGVVVAGVAAAKQQAMDIIMEVMAAKPL